MLPYSDWADSALSFTYTYSDSLTWVTVSSLTGVGEIITFDTAGLSDDTYTFEITASDDGETTATEFTIVVNAVAAPSTPYFEDLV